MGYICIDLKIKLGVCVFLYGLMNFDTDDIHVSYG